MNCIHCGKHFVRLKGSVRRTCNRSCQVAWGWANASEDARQRRCELASEAQTKAGSGRKLNEMRWNRLGERERSAQQNRERWADPDYKARVSIAISTAHATPEVQVKLSNAATRRWNDPIYRANCLAAMIVSHRTLEHRQLISRIRRAQWQDPTIRARFLAALYRRAPAQSAMMKRRWAQKRIPLVVMRPPVTLIKQQGFSMLGGRLARPIVTNIRGRPIELRSGNTSNASSLE